MSYDINHMKKLTRSKTNKTIAGVLGGIGEYFNVDPVLIRVLFVFSTLISGLFPGIIAYIIACILVPEDGPVIHESAANSEKEN